MLKSLATLLAAVAMTLGSMALAQPAEATRPIVGYPYKDMCKNIAGVQPIYQTIGSGPYRVVKPGVCKRRSK